jgi:transcriptional/translational regulatory protein YebC/TACO1
MAKFGGNLGESGSVAWQFENRGMLTVPTAGVSEDDLFETAVDYGAEELDEEDTQFVITVPAERVYELEEALKARQFPVDAIEVGLEPTTTVSVEGSDARRLLQLLDALDDLEDIQKVYSNCDIAEEELESYST